MASSEASAIDASPDACVCAGQDYDRNALVFSMLTALDCFTSLPPQEASGQTVSKLDAVVYPIGIPAQSKSTKR